MLKFRNKIFPAKIFVLFKCHFPTCIQVAVCVCEHCMKTFSMRRRSGSPMRNSKSTLTLTYVHTLTHVHRCRSAGAPGNCHLFKNNSVQKQNMLHSKIQSSLMMWGFCGSGFSIKRQVSGLILGHCATACLNGYCPDKPVASCSVITVISA